MGRPESERSPTVLDHEVARAKRIADVFEDRVTDPLMRGAPCTAHLILAVALDMAKAAPAISPMGRATHGRASITGSKRRFPAPKI